VSEATRRWYARHKDDPEIRERLNANHRRWILAHKDEPEFRKRKKYSQDKSRLKGRDDPRRREKWLANTRKWLDSKPEAKECIRNSVANWQIANSEKVKAHHAVQYALRVGKLIRPDKCSRCGVIPSSRIDGVTGIHAHHNDYSKPLQVEWLCAFCHGNERRRVA